jgi:hypothetical protein
LRREALLIELSRRDGPRGRARMEASADGRARGPSRAVRALHEAPRGGLVERCGGDFPAAA